jgi:hypothetical protein
MKKSGMFLGFKKDQGARTAAKGKKQTGRRGNEAEVVRYRVKNFK